MLTYESEDELGETIRNLKEAMGILADYVSEISVEVKAIAQGDLTRNGDDITDFLKFLNKNTGKLKGCVSYK